MLQVSIVGSYHTSSHHHHNHHNITCTILFLCTGLWLQKEAIITIYAFMLYIAACPTANKVSLFSMRTDRKRIWPIIMPNWPNGKSLTYGLPINSQLNSFYNKCSTLMTTYFGKPLRNKCAISGARANQSHYLKYDAYNFIVVPKHLQ